MRKFLIFSFSVMSFGIMASSTNAQGPLGTILKRMDDHNKSLQTLKAKVTMVKTNVQLNVSDTNVGTTQYITKIAGKGKMYVRIDWTQPVQEQMAVIGDSYELYRPRLGQVIYGKVEQSKGSPAVGGALAFMNMSKDQLKANYDVIYIGEEAVSGGTKTWHLQLTPKTQTSYKLAELWVDGNGMPLQAKITEQNSDTTTVFLSDLVKNQKVDTKAFALNYPNSVKKIKA